MPDDLVLFHVILVVLAVLLLGAEEVKEQRNGHDHL